MFIRMLLLKSQNTNQKLCQGLTPINMLQQCKHLNIRNFENIALYFEIICYHVTIQICLIKHFAECYDKDAKIKRLEGQHEDVGQCDINCLPI